jgi:predicted GH43/DUF377 family glycosyl hydrolase
VIKNRTVPIFEPEEPWEREGFVPNVVFSNGWVLMPDNTVLMYYGGADTAIGVAKATIGDLLAALDVA